MIAPMHGRPSERCRDIPMRVRILRLSLEHRSRRRQKLAAALEIAPPQMQRTDGEVDASSNGFGHARGWLIEPFPDALQRAKRLLERNQAPGQKDREEHL